jgi:hypothetical protein
MVQATNGRHIDLTIFGEKPHKNRPNSSIGPKCLQQIEELLHSVHVVQFFIITGRLFGNTGCGKKVIPKYF